MIGGVSQHGQVRALARGVDVLVATPGRLLDHLSQRTVRLDQVETVVLDEVDRMLDLGFIHPIRRIMRHLPARRQALFFSATLPPEIRGLAAELLHEPLEVSVVPTPTPAERVAQSVILVDGGAKQGLLQELLADPSLTRTLVFTRTKHRADHVARRLGAAGIAAAAIHGNKSQSQRERALGQFRAGRARVLVATDIAARGLHIDEVSHVVNFDLPYVAEDYVHRIGRTARAGAAGTAISFCDVDEQSSLRGIETLTRQTLARTDRSSGWGTARRRPFRPPASPPSRTPAGEQPGRLIGAATQGACQRAAVRLSRARRLQPCGDCRMLRLYHVPLCPFCRKVRIVLREKGLAAELVEVQPWVPSDDFLRLNPASEAPILADGAIVVCDSQAITDYLEEAYPQSTLLGRGQAQRNEVRRLVAWFDTKFAREVTDLLWREKLVKRWAKRGFPRSEALREAAQNIRFHLTYVDYLYQSRKWLAGEELSLADVVAAAHLSVLDYLGDVPWTEAGGAKEWYAKMKSRPSVRQVLADRLTGLKPPMHYDDPDF